MLLSQINKINKEDFLKLCVYAAMSNGVFADEEKETLFSYCREMDIDEHVPDTSEPFEALIERICGETSKEEKKIYILELLSFIKSDGTYDEKEQEFMLKVVTGLKLTKEVLDRFDRILDRYLLIEQEIFAALAE